MKFFIILILLTLTDVYGAAEKLGPWNLTELHKTPQWIHTDKAAKPGMTGLLYSSIPLKNKAVQVFAYYSAPDGTAPEGGWPAVVCVHGGGGTAFSQWVKVWNDHGYAAISMDLEGHYPLLKDPKDRQQGRAPTANPGLSRVGIFNDYEKPIDEQWYYHAVAQIILAHSLIRSFPEVNAEKIGITGVSWGGTLTSTTMGVDKRFKFAIPSYGCGFLLGSEGNQGREIKKGKHWAIVEKYYDGSAYFSHVKMPVLWVNGTNDVHFSMPATQKSSRAVEGPVAIRFGVEMAHGHKPVWMTEECYVFADSIVKNAPPLLKVSKPEVNKMALTVKVAGDAQSAVLVYTTDKDKIWPERKWKTTKATISGQGITADIPQDAIAAFFNVTDKRGLMVSSEFIEFNR
jgi:dienelactone hydrolase